MANWYAYLGTGDPTLAANYRLSSAKPSCTTGEEIGSIFLNQATAIPTTFDGVSNYIANSLVTQIPQPTGVGVKAFVYLRAPIS